MNNRNCLSLQFKGNGHHHLILSFIIITVISTSRWWPYGAGSTSVVTGLTWPVVSLYKPCFRGSSCYWATPAWPHTVLSRISTLLFVLPDKYISFEFFWLARQFRCSHKETMSSVGVVGYANESSTNLHQLVQMLAYVVCTNGHKHDFVLCDRYVASFQFPPDIWVVGSQVINVCNVPQPESLVLYSV